jgi:hypothetical protein
MVSVTFFSSRTSPETLLYSATVIPQLGFGRGLKPVNSATWLSMYDDDACNKTSLFFLEKDNFILKEQW